MTDISDERDIAEACAHVRDRWQEALRDHKGGILGVHTDGTTIAVVQQEWHIDHAPRLEAVRKNGWRTR